MASHAYLLDTSVWIVAFRRNPPESFTARFAVLIASGVSSMNDIIKLEVLLGVRRDDERVTTEQALSGLEPLPLDDATWSIAADLGSRLRAAGIVASIPDLVIAANAMSHDATLVHRDSDFELIASYSTLRTESLL
ncbi:MAG TPA: PIN domain-containing protein [Dehalococcoidia bacterium]|nr:PIN domain-containing protein [Dehalococcoidia bacterium]